MTELDSEFPALVIELLQEFGVECEVLGFDEGKEGEYDVATGEVVSTTFSFFSRISPIQTSKTSNLNESEFFMDSTREPFPGQTVLVNEMKFVIKEVETIRSGGLIAAFKVTSEQIQTRR